MDGAHVPDQIPHKLAMRWYGPYEVLEVFAGGGTVRLRLPEELGRISTVVNIRRLKFSELRDAELSTFRPLVSPSLRYQERRVCCLDPLWAQGRDGERERERELYWEQGSWTGGGRVS
jgi:hypothetical protein